MNILLVYPEYPDTFWSFKHVMKFIKRKAAYPPLGLLTVAAMLPEKWNKKLVDVNVRALTDEDIEWADIVFVGAMLVQLDSAREIIDKCKAAGKTVVAGGPGFTTQCNRFENVDHFVLNEAEITLQPFLDDLEQGTPKPLYTSEERPDVAQTPVPLWSLLNFKDYATMSLQYSRGCPFDCEFCDIIVMNGRYPRTKSAKQFINEFQSLRDAGWEGSVFIVDDNFIGNKRDVKKMLPELIKWQEKRDYPFQILTEASLNLAGDKELLEMMRAANFHKVFLGIETPNEESLEECHKKQNLSHDIGHAVKIINSYGMQVMGGFIVGFDSDKESIFDKQIKFIQQIGVVIAMVGMLNVLPKTRLWERLKTEGRLTDDSTGENTDGHLNFIPKMRRELLVEGYERLVATIYSPKCYYKRIHTFIKNFKPSVKRKTHKGDVYAFLRSLWTIGILSRSRFRYWQLLFKIALTKASLFPVAIELAIMGHHFRKVLHRTKPA